MFYLYSLIYLISLIFMLPLEFMKRPGVLRKRWLREKLGYIKPNALSSETKTVWLHAVSVGEAIAAVPFIKDLKDRYPGIGFIVSTITDTGQKVASEKLSGLAQIIYLPFDLGFILRRAIKSVNPALFITMETEIWPNIFREMKRHGAAVAIVNGRISGSSFSGYRRIKFFMEGLLKNVDLFCMQDEIYARRAIEIGADERRVKVTGNFKFDIRTSGEKPGWADIIAGPVIVAGSTHRGEEDLIIDTYAALKKDFPSLNLVIAPRHPERFKEVEELLRAKGVSFIKKSQLRDVSRLLGTVMLLDVMGELFATYGVSDIAIIGGSFIEHGGQNPLEPAYWAKPVVCGPHMENFPFIEEFLKEGGALRVGRKELYHGLKELLSSPEKRYSIGRNAKEFCTKNTGAVDKAIKALQGYL